MSEPAMSADQQIDKQLHLSEQHALAIRIWHWFSYAAITFTITLVILASTLFTTKDNVPVVQEQVQSKGGIVTPVQARAVAHEFSDKLWMLHKYVGFVITFLLLSRIIIEFALPSKEKLSNKIRRIATFRYTTQVQQTNRSHYLWVQYGYLTFYFIILVMTITGLGLAFEDVPFLGSIHEPLSQVHMIFQWGLYTYIILHIVGVILAETDRFPGIVSRMIHKRNVS